MAPYLPKVLNFVQMDSLKIFFNVLLKFLFKKYYHLIIITYAIIVDIADITSLYKPIEFYFYIIIEN